MVALAGAHFFGEKPPEVDVLGITLGGVLLALLVAVGGLSWIGLRTFARSLPGMKEDTPSIPLTPLSTGRTLALWAVICLIIALPIGLTASSLLRGGP